MKRQPSPTLARAAETISPAELCLAPELSTLAALDATLLAATTLLEFNYPYLTRSPGKPAMASPEGVEEHLIESISILAKALRGNLSAYYAAIRASCEDQEVQKEFLF
ncbi:MAG: hypothetical protein GX442_22745 [Candidatus Riflebacteria bacterium]|nr:hypothetical protein [Candidatus Riflebacteria bacterium]